MIINTTEQLSGIKNGTHSYKSAEKVFLQLQKLIKSQEEQVYVHYKSESSTLSNRHTEERIFFTDLLSIITLLGFNFSIDDQFNITSKEGVVKIHFSSQHSVVYHEKELTLYFDLNKIPVDREEDTSKDIMLESEMEQYLTDNGYNIFDEENCTDSVTVAGFACDYEGYDGYLLEGVGELDQTQIFIKNKQPTQQKAMKINGLSTYQILEETADIVLSVEFPKEVAEKHNLNAATVWVTYNLDGQFQHIDLASEGNSVSFELTPPELKQVADYIQENNLKEELMKQIFHRQLTVAGDIGDSPLLDGYKRLGTITEVYPSLNHYKEALSSNKYNYEIQGNLQGDRITLERATNDYVRFICEGTEAAAASHLKSLFTDTEIVSVTLESYNRDSELLKESQTKIESYEKKIKDLSVYSKTEIGSVISKEEVESVKSSLIDSLFQLESKLRKLNALEQKNLTEVDEKNRVIITQRIKAEIDLLSNTKSRLEQESYNSAMGHNPKPTIEDITEGLREILECTDGFYTADNGNRLDPSLSKFSGPINVMRKVAAELLDTLQNRVQKEAQTLDDNEMQHWLEQKGHKLFDPEKDKETDMDKLHRLAVSYGWKFNPEKYEWTK